MSIAEAVLEKVKALPEEDQRSVLEFIGKLSSERAQPGTTLSAAETRLIKRINRGLPEEVASRLEKLTLKRKRGTLTKLEHQQLLKLTHQIETLDAERAAALLELAKLRQVPLRLLMKHMGIKATALHG